MKQEFREIIGDITQKMGSGMCVFLQSEVETMEDWDEVRVDHVTEVTTCYSSKRKKNLCIIYLLLL